MLSLVCTIWNLIWLINIILKKTETKYERFLKLCFSQYAPFPCEIFYKPNLTAVYTVKDVSSSIYSGSLSNYWFYSLKLSGDWLKLKCTDIPVCMVLCYPWQFLGWSQLTGFSLKPQAVADRSSWNALVRPCSARGMFSS